MLLYVGLCLILVNLAESCRFQGTFSTSPIFITVDNNSIYEYSFSSASFNKTEAEVYCTKINSVIANRYANNESNLFEISDLQAQQNGSLNVPYYIGVGLNSGEFIDEQTGEVIPQSSPFWGPDQPNLLNECVVLDKFLLLNQTDFELRLFTTRCSDRFRVICQRLRGSEWSDWATWSNCNSFQRERIRTCLFPTAYGDTYCDVSSETQVDACNYTNSFENATISTENTTAVMQICDEQCTKIKIIVGSVVGVILFLVLVAVIAVAFYRKHHQNSSSGQVNTHTAVNHHKIEQSSIKLKPTSTTPQVDSRNSYDTGANNRFAGQLQDENEEVEYVNFEPPNQLVEENYLDPVNQRQSDYENGGDIYVNEPSSPQLNVEEEYVAMQESTYVNFHSP